MSRAGQLFVTRSADPRAVAEARARSGARRAVVFALGDDPSALAGARYERVLLHGLEPDEPLPPALLRDIFSRKIRSIRHVDDAGRLSRYCPFAHRPARVLDVFPGAPFPLDKGANQRAFGLLHHLNRSGIGTDLLLTTSSRWKLPWLADVLRAVAPNVHTYRPDKPFLPAPLRVRRELERAYRLTRGRLASAPDLFMDRLATRASRDGARRLAELVGDGRYEAVIVNFAWMTGMIEEARAIAPRVKWICDTHDVQFVRGATQNEREPRLWVDHAAERRAELAALDKYDAVLAISEPDRDKLAKHLGEDRVLLAPSGFDYAYQPISSAGTVAVRGPLSPAGRVEGGLSERSSALAAEPPLPLASGGGGGLAEPSSMRPFTFGFIGRAMPANLLAFERLMDAWWPAISAALPGSRLHVAGTVCDARGVRGLVGRHPSVELLAYVPSLASFYREIDVALNPVVVRGGLNFKSLEALAAGRLLVTTPMGSRCLGDDAPVIVAESERDVADAVRALAKDPGEHHGRRVRAQAWCMERFSEERAFAELRGFLG